MKYVSLFSGIEAASVAWKPLGWTPLAFAEIEPFPCALLAQRFPEVPNHGDVTGFDWSVYRGVCDLLVGGSPCQSFSVAGLRGSLTDDRGNLALAFCKVAHAIDPKYVVYENVPGLLNTEDNAFGCLLAAMVGEDDALTPPAYMGSKWPDAGAISGPRRTAAWRILDAQFFGVPQRRRRVFVVSVRGSGNWRCAEAILPLSDGLPWDIAPSREAGSRAAACVSASPSSSRSPTGNGQETLVANCVDAHMGMGGPDDNAAQGNHLVPVAIHDTCPAIKARGSKGPSSDGDGDGDGDGAILVPMIVGALASGGTPNGHGTAGVNDQAVMAGHVLPIAYRTSGNSGVMEQGDKTAALTTNTDPNSTIITVQETPDAQIQMREVRRSTDRQAESLKDCADDGRDDSLSEVRPFAFQTRIGRNGRGQPKEVTDALTSCDGGTHADSKPHVVTSEMAVRRLTPLECERLQGFPDGHTDITFRGKRAADGPRYKSIGNSMAVPVLSWIGRRIQQVDQLAGDQNG